MFFYIMKFCFFFSVYKKCRPNIIKKTRKCDKKRLVKAIKISLKKKKTESIQYRNLFIENKPSEEEKKQKASICSRMIQKFF